MTGPVLSVTDALRADDVTWDIRTAPCISDSCSAKTHWALDVEDPKRVVPDEVWDEIHDSTPFLVTLNGARWLPPGYRDG